MLTATVLLCLSATLCDATHAIASIRAPGVYAIPYACAAAGMALLASSPGLDLRGLVVVVKCVPRKLKINAIGKE